MNFPREVYNFLLMQLPDFVFNDLLVPIWQLHFHSGHTDDELNYIWLFSVPMSFLFIRKILRLIKRLY